MNRLILIAVVGFLGGCQSAPPITLQSSNGKQTVVYGPYFQNEKPIVGRSMKVDAILSLGPERVPKSSSIVKKLDYGAGQVEAVWEFYLTNVTDKPIEVRIEDFSCSLFPGRIEPSRITIPPKGFIKCDPLLATTSNYVTKPWTYTMTVFIDGVRHKIDDKVVRVTIDQLKVYEKKG